MRGVVCDGGFVRELRGAQGLTQEQLAALSTCDVKTIRKVERSGRVDVFTANKIAHCLGIDYTRLLSRTNRWAQLIEQNLRTINDNAAKSKADSRDLTLKTTDVSDHVHSNYPAVTDWLAAIDDRHAKTLAETYCDDALLRIPTASILPMSGLFSGKAALEEHARASFDHVQLPKDYNRHSVIAAHRDRVFAEDGPFRVTLRKTGCTVYATSVKVFTIRRGKICKLCVFRDIAFPYQFQNNSDRR